MVYVKPGVQERILLHLRDFSDYIDSVEVPFSLSQMGIANAVAIARSNVPRAIAGLKDDGMLIVRQAHVSGVSRKRKAYFLTNAGIALADETWKRLQDFSLRVILSAGDTQKTILGEIHEILPFTMRIVDIIRYLDENGVLDARSLSEDLIERDLSKHVEKQLVTSLEDLPRLRHFYGRETELDNMVKLLDARATTLIVPGIAGIGKTTMAAKLVERFVHRRNLFYHRCQDWEGARTFLEAISEWLAAIGDTMLSEYLVATPVPRATDAARIITDSVSSFPCLIVIDDFHKVHDKVLVQTLQSISLSLVEMEEDVGLVLFSRSYRESIPLKDAEGRIVCIPMELRGLDQDACRNLLTGFGEMEDDQFLYIYHLARGHPLVIELINRGAPATAFHETLEKYVTVEIFSKLSGEQKRVLGALAVFRESVPLAALAEQKLKTDELDSLVEQGLARSGDSDTYDVHDLVREFILQGLDEPAAIALHQRASEWYASKDESPERHIELAHHLLSAVEYEAAAEHLDSIGRGLVRGGHLEILELLDKVVMDELPAKLVASILQIKGDIYSLLGKFDDSEDCFNQSYDVATSSNSKLIAAQVLSSKADIALKRGSLDKSLELHLDALNIFNELSVSIWSARTYNNLGFLYRRKGDKNNARKAYSNVENILEAENNPSLAPARISLARAYLDMGEVELAREHAFAAHSETDELGDSVLHARAQAVLGRYYAKTDDFELALHHYSESMAAMEDAGDPIALVDISLLLGEVLVEAGRAEEAMDHYRQGLAIAESNDLRMQMGELLSRLGGTAPDRQRRMEYLQRALTVFRELGAKARMSEVQQMVHQSIMGR